MKATPDEAERRIEISAIVSEAVAEAFEDAKALQKEGIPIYAAVGSLGYRQLPGHTLGVSAGADLGEQAVGLAQLFSPGPLIAALAP